MRVITGKYGGRKFHPPQNIPTRPTTDFAKTGLFNILNNEFDFPEISYLDLFAGTGSLSYEMASRGCMDITCVDQNQKCAAFIEQTAKDWNIEGLKVFRSDVFTFIDRCQRKFDLVFAGPPYPLPNIDELPEIVLGKPLLNDDGIFVLETSPNHRYDTNPMFFQKRNYGDTNFHFFRFKTSGELRVES